MKRFFAVFVLTPAEQRLVIFVVVLLVGGAWLKHQRELNYEAAAHPPPAEASASTFPERVRNR